MSVRASSVGLVLTAGLFLSTAGLGVRLLEQASGMQIVFYRSLGMGVFLLLVVLARYRSNALRAFLAMRAASLFAAVFFAGASVAIIYALLNTTVANAMFIISLAPFFTAIAGWLLLGEPVRLRTWLAMAAAAGGVLIMVEGALSGEGLLGMVYALAMALCYAGFNVSIRAGRLGDMTPAICFSGLGLAAVSALWVEPFLLPPRDLLICLGLGVFQAGLGGLLLVQGARGLPAVQVNFLAMMEVVLSPVWVWLVVNERPATATLVGGAVILAAISQQALSAGSGTQAPPVRTDPGPPR